MWKVFRLVRACRVRRGVFRNNPVNCPVFVHNDKVRTKGISVIVKIRAQALNEQKRVFSPPPTQNVKIRNQLFNNNLLSEKAIIVMEANRPIALEKIDYQKNKEYHYGDILVYIYWRQV